MIINGEFVIGMGYRVRAGIATHGHHDHLLWHPLFGEAPHWASRRTVELAGDMLSDVELPMPLDPDDLPAYLAGLDVLAPFVARARLLVPGHGRPTATPIERLDADRRYLDAVLDGRDPDDPRRANPGMAHVHERVLVMARRDRG